MRSTSYLINLVLITIACVEAMGLLVAFAVRHRHSPRLRYTVGAAIATNDRHRGRAGGPAAPKRPDRRAAVLRLRTGHPTRAPSRRGPRSNRPASSTRSLTRSSSAWRGWSTRPSERTSLTDRPTITIASDLHNNFFALPVLDRAVERRSAVLRRRLDRPRLAAGVAPSQSRGRARTPVRSSSPATTTATASRSTSPGAGRRCSRSKASSTPTARTVT